MSRETVQRWCERTVATNPHPRYCTGALRFGPWCYDCSGFTYMGYKADGKTIPADSASVALWGRANHQVRTISESRLSDLLVHDKYGNPYASTGPRGHIGVFVRMSGTSRVVTYESASSNQGVGVFVRDIGFWAISVGHPAFWAGDGPGTAPELPVDEEHEVYRIVKGDKANEWWLTNWLEKRWIRSVAEANAIVKAGVTQGAGLVTWPQAWVDAIPVKKSD